MLYQTIQVPLSEQPYPVYVGPGLLKQSDLFSRHIHGKQVMIVTQKKIAALYLGDLRQTLAAYDCAVTYLPAGEHYKNLHSWQRVIDHLVDEQHERGTTIVALGGGIVGDVAGFAAACYLRGVNYIQVPTTLIAQVDSAIGGKTGVNHAAGKNLIGAFHQPQCVIADTTTLETLARREFIAGLAEVIKYGLIADAAFFSWLEKNHLSLLQGRQEELLHAICTSVSIKAGIVAEDTKESGQRRRLLNFGHTLGHALEASYNYRELLHGEAVALGMRMAARLSTDLGWLTASDELRIQALLSASGLPLRLNKKLNREKLLAHLLQDKKIKDKQIQWVMLKAIGEAIVTSAVPEEALMKIIPH